MNQIEIQMIVKFLFGSQSVVHRNLIFNLFLCNFSPLLLLCILKGHKCGLNSVYQKYEFGTDKNSWFSIKSSVRIKLDTSNVKTRQK